MPNIIGWSLNEVKIYCKLVNINLKYTGSGYVKTQSIKEDTKIKTNSELVVELK